MGAVGSRLRQSLLAVVLTVAGGIGIAEGAIWGIERWTADERELIASLRLNQLAPLPADPSNRFEQLPAAAELGKRLFNDVRFSRNQAVSCASCHAPDKQFQDGRALGKGVGTGTRRAMPLMGAAHSPWLFWDGRKDSLWSQALGPLEDAVEHGGNRARYAHLLQAHYRAEYEALFGALPDLARVPQDAGPLGDAGERAAWEAMPPAAREQVSRVFAHMGKAIAAYERTLGYGPSRFDRYAQAVVANDAGGQQVLTSQELKGLRLFIGKGQCITCHSGPLLSDQHFHNTGVPPLDRSRPDAGRAAAIAKVQGDEFNCLGSFSDAGPQQCQELRFMVTDDPKLEAAFKTPSLRNVALRPPYMHAGQFASLDEVVAHYAKSPPAVRGTSELASGGSAHAERKPIRLSVQEIQDLAVFLGALSGPVIESKP